MVKWNIHDLNWSVYAPEQGLVSRGDYIACINGTMNKIGEKVLQILTVDNIFE